jgi:signal transduction histidine kinase
MLAVLTTIAHPSVEILDAFVKLLGSTDAGEGDAFWDRLAQAMCETSELSRAIVVRYDPGQRRIRLAGSHAVDRTPFTDVPLSIESIDVAKEALLEDVVVETMPPFDGRVPAVFTALANAGPLVCVPLCAEQQRIGVVVGQRVGAPEPLAAGPRDALWLLGKTAALAATARIATFQHTRARALQERIDLARDIHDRVVQRLFGVNLALAAATDRDLPAGERARCATEIGEALAELRSALARPLGPHVRETTSTLAEELARLPPTLPGVQVTVAQRAEVPPEAENLAQSVLAEAVLNAQRHAQVRRLDVRVDADGDTFVLEVVNDGVEGAAPHRTGTGMGLRLAALTALGVGGLVEFGPRGAGSWIVRLVVPR